MLIYSSYAVGIQNWNSSCIMEHFYLICYIFWIRMINSSQYTKNTLSASRLSQLMLERDFKFNPTVDSL